MATVDRAILIVVDGLRPDALKQETTPNLYSLMQRGAYSLKAQTVMPSITLPTHMTMFHSLPPTVHGVTSNLHVDTPKLTPGIVELVRKAQLETAVFYSWEELRDLWRPGNVTYSWFLNIYGKPRDYDIEVAQAAAEYIVQQPPAFSFVYLGMVDELAHRRGWMTPGYFEAVLDADKAIGYLLGKLESAGLLEGTAILVLADHGGHERGHGDDIPEDMTIPWVLAGPGVKRGYEMNGNISMLDTAPTLAHLLGLPVPEFWQGRVVEEALV